LRSYSTLKVTPQCIHYQGVDSPCIHHRGVDFLVYSPRGSFVSPCILLRGVSTPRCIYYWGITNSIPRCIHCRESRDSPVCSTQGIIDFLVHSLLVTGESKIRLPGVFTTGESRRPGVCTTGESFYSFELFQGLAVALKRIII
jgi:hypothetical protein